MEDNLFDKQMRELNEKIDKLEAEVGAVRVRFLWWIVVIVGLCALVIAAAKVDDSRCYALGGHWTAHGFGSCVDEDGNRLHYR